jgi:hypothetical protein
MLTDEIVMLSMVSCELKKHVKIGEGAIKILSYEQL